MRTIPAAAALAAALLATSPALAEHNNPWAEDTSDLTARHPDENQSFSADRPGEDEMHGVRNAMGRESVPGPGGRTDGE